MDNCKPFMEYEYREADLVVKFIILDLKACGITLSRFGLSLATHGQNIQWIWFQLPLDFIYKN